LNAEVRRLERIDRVGLEMSARSFAHKRDRRRAAEDYFRGFRFFGAADLGRDAFSVEVTWPSLRAQLCRAVAPVAAAAAAAASARAMSCTIRSRSPAPEIRSVAT
jgi:hypothetical protein